MYDFQKSDSFWRAFVIWREYPLSANTRWPLSEFGWVQARYGSWRAVVSYTLTSVSGKLLRFHVVDQGAQALSAFPLYFWTRNSQKFILNQMNYWTTGPILIPCTQNPEPGKEASWCLVLMHNFLQCNIFTKTSFWSRSQNWNNFGRMYRTKRVFQTMLNTAMYQWLRLSRRVSTVS